jgi:hypothetical protein
MGLFKSGPSIGIHFLFQFISGSIAKNTSTDFMPVLKLFVLYDEVEPLPVPDVTDRSCTLKLSAAAIFIHLTIKAQVLVLFSSKNNFVAVGPAS